MTASLSDSLALLVGRQIFDGAAAEQLAKRYEVSSTTIDHAWFDCRERLSRHFAEKEGYDYRLLSDNDLQARVTDALRLLLAWREAALHIERLQVAQQNKTAVDETEDSSESD